MYWQHKQLAENEPKPEKPFYQSILKSLFANLSIISIFAVLSLFTTNTIGTLRSNENMLTFKTTVGPQDKLAFENLILVFDVPEAAPPKLTKPSPEKIAPAEEKIVPLPIIPPPPLLTEEPPLPPTTVSPTITPTTHPEAHQAPAPAESKSRSTHHTLGFDDGNDLCVIANAAEWRMPKLYTEDIDPTGKFTGDIIVICTFVIDTTGRTIQVTTDQDQQYPIFTKKIRDAVEQLQFTPGSSNVRGQIRFSYSFIRI